MNDESKKALWENQIQARIRMFGNEDPFGFEEGYIHIDDHIRYHLERYECSKFRQLTYFAVPKLPKELLFCADNGLFSYVAIHVNDKENPVINADRMAEVLNAVEKHITDSGYGYYVKIDTQVEMGHAYLMRQVMGRQRELAAMVLMFIREPAMSVYGGFRKLGVVE